MPTTSIPSSPIVFYDIATRPPVEKNCYSPNPWKTRLALNFKGLPYSTSWVALPDIAKVRSSLKVPPCRRFADGTDFFTLPIIEDPATNSLVGDSFDIAVYLQNTYPNSGGDLFPPQTIDYVFTHDLALLVPLSECRESEFPEYAKFNVNVDAAFSAHVQLTVQGFPFDPATAEISKAEFVRRAGVTCWEDFALVGEEREKMKDSFRNMLGGLAKLFLRDTSGPFLLGTRASYADLIVGGWLRMMRATLPESEWEEVRSWHGGLFGRLHDALEVYAEVK
jgi:glutathione S-transferase